MILSRSVGAVGVPDLGNETRLPTRVRSNLGVNTHRKLTSVFDNARTEIFTLCSAFYKLAPFSPR